MLISLLLRYSKLKPINDNNINWHFLCDHKLFLQISLVSLAQGCQWRSGVWRMAFWHCNITDRQTLICILLKRATEPMQRMGCQACHQNILIKLKKKLSHSTRWIVRGTRPEKVTSSVTKGFLYKGRVCFTASHNYSPSAPLSLPTVNAEVYILHPSQT